MSFPPYSFKTASPVSPRPPPQSWGYSCIHGHAWLLAQVLGFEFRASGLTAGILITELPFQLRHTLTLLSPGSVLKFEEKMRNVPWDFLTTKHNY